MMKKLVRIRLINWHYFENETISVKGSTLISGENTSGKSTILDAIQMVLTTNTRKFNKAANEKSNRNLKGYVRAKTGSDDSAYLRKKGVISYVALEFFEEKTSKYFTLGVKIDSPDIDSELKVKWFSEECKLEDLTFITNGKPSIDEDFRCNQRKVKLVPQVSKAKAMFGHRLGNLEDRFFDMIPKSLAFKPMDNVKDFINRFILSEKKIEVDSLRRNIQHLKELEDLMKETEEKIESLQRILDKKEEITQAKHGIRVNDVLIKKAEVENILEIIEKYKLEHQRLIQSLHTFEIQQSLIAKTLDNERTRETDLRVALGSNQMSQLVERVKNNIKLYEDRLQSHEVNFKRFKAMIDNYQNTLEFLADRGEFIISKQELDCLVQSDSLVERKSDVVKTIKDTMYALSEKARKEEYRLEVALHEKKENKSRVLIDIKNLENRVLTYPENTNRLVSVIEKEFKSRNIQSEPYVFSSLLDINNKHWQEAVEGYLSSQRFYVLVEPKYHDIALQTYNKHKNSIHSVGLINTRKLDTQLEAPVDSLAYVVSSVNRYAKAYINFLLNKVVCVDTVDELKEHTIAITSDCFLYKNKATRKINPKIYSTPYIGAHAIEVQLSAKKEELSQIVAEISELENKLENTRAIVASMEKCNITVIEDHLNLPFEMNKLQLQLKKEKQELQQAESDPSLIELQMQLRECVAIREQHETEFNSVNQKIGSTNTKIEETMNKIHDKTNHWEQQSIQFKTFCDEDEYASKLGFAKYDQNRNTKSNQTIIDNFSPLRNGYENKVRKLEDDLVKEQQNYCNVYTCDFGTGYDQVDDYASEHYKLKSAELIKYKSDLDLAKENCHLEFRESFLAKLKENIEDARREFDMLNHALRNIYYGEDSYRFKLTYDKSKERLYKMIVSKKNEAGFNLWSDSFSDEYQAEMDDLFLKLTTHDDLGEKVTAEYTDYRRYLDYDIQIVKKDGRTQSFSKIYGEKSGGETQTPYYVAIAASFSQLYKYGDTTRIILFDEAFDKMDDNRIGAMMDFLNSQNFQIVLATPPSKLEIIGEKVDTILLALRDGESSFIEEYDF